ncbi:MAG: SPFH domain-containing protein [Actinomycetaceae bacterium]|nr:SPFH domain-containing protein [Actinomycetaceae bacterium]
MALPWIEIVECLDPDPQLVLWRYPDPDGRIKSGAQLLVRENQSALLLARGQASAVYLPGTHTLPTENIPVLSDLMGWKYGFASPHIYDIFYVAMRQFVDLKWGTPAPVMMQDSRFGQIRVRAFGSYSVRIVDVAKFFREYAGAYPVLTIRDLEVQLRDYIAAKFGEILATHNIPVIDFAANLSSVNARLQPAIAPYFEDLGVEITQFTIASVTLPDEVNEYYDKVTGMNMVGDMARFQAFNTALATSNPETGVGQGVQGGMAMGMMMGHATQQMGQVSAPYPPQGSYPAGGHYPAQGGQYPPQGAQYPPAAPAAGAPLSSPEMAGYAAPTQTTGSMPSSGEDLVERLGRLKKMLDAGLITEEDFAAKKAQILEAL